MRSSSKNITLALGLLIILGAIWGSGYSLARFATTHGVSPLGYAFWQSLGPAILVFIFTKSAGSRIPVSWRHLRFYFICGLVGIALPNTNMYFAAAKLPAGLLAVIVNTVPLMTYALAFALRMERFYYLRFFGILMGAAGIMLMTIPKTSLPSVDLTPWALLALITPFCFASCAVYAAKNSPKDCDAAASAAGMMLCSALLLTPLVIATHNFYALWPPFAARDWVILLEILLSSIGYILFFQLLKIAGPVFYSLVGGVVALTGLFWGWVIFGETLNRWNGLAVLCILIAIGFVTAGQWSARTQGTE
jgi:drug/metabolite transporter (DMT)-like permease